jgi:hypothetical protein
MQALGAVLGEQKVVADPGVGVLRVVHWVDCYVHARGTRHGLVEALLTRLGRRFSCSYHLSPSLTVGGEEFLKIVG